MSDSIISPTVLELASLLIILANTFIIVYYAKRIKGVITKDETSKDDKDRSSIEDVMYILIGVSNSVIGLTILYHTQFGLRPDVFYILLQTANRTTIVFTLILGIVKTSRFCHYMPKYGNFITVLNAVLTPLIWAGITITEGKIHMQRSGAVYGVVYWHELGPWFWYPDVAQSYLVALVVTAGYIVLPIVAVPGMFIYCAGSARKDKDTNSACKDVSYQEKAISLTLLILTMTCAMCYTGYTLWFISCDSLFVKKDLFNVHWFKALVYVGCWISPIVNAVLMPLVLLL